MAGGPAEQPGTRALPDAQQRPEKLPTVDSKIPGQVETNPELGRFPDVKRSEWTPDGKLRLVVNELPQRKLTPNELKHYGEKYGPYYGAVKGGMEGASWGGAAGALEGPRAAVAGALAGAALGGAAGMRTGSYDLQDRIRAWNPNVNVKRYGDLEFEEGR